jgi:hypothetical protein
VIVLITSYSGVDLQVNIGFKTHAQETPLAFFKEDGNLLNTSWARCSVVYSLQIYTYVLVTDA